MKMKKRKFFETVECYIDGSDPKLPTGYTVLERSGVEVSTDGMQWHSSNCIWILGGKRLLLNEDGTLFDMQNRRLIPEGHDKYPIFGA